MAGLKYRGRLFLSCGGDLGLVDYVASNANRKSSSWGYYLVMYKRDMSTDFEKMQRDLEKIGIEAIDKNSDVMMSLYLKDDTDLDSTLKKVLEYVKSFHPSIGLVASHVDFKSSASLV